MNRKKGNINKVYNATPILIGLVVWLIFMGFAAYLDYYLLGDKSGCLVTTLGLCSLAGSFVWTVTD